GGAREMLWHLPQRAQSARDRRHIGGDHEDSERSRRRAAHEARRPSGDHGPEEEDRAGRHSRSRGTARTEELETATRDEDRQDGATVGGHEDVVRRGESRGGRPGRALRRDMRRDERARRRLAPGHADRDGPPERPPRLLHEAQGRWARRRGERPRSSEDGRSQRRRHDDPGRPGDAPRELGTVKPGPKPRIHLDRLHQRYGWTGGKYQALVAKIIEENSGVMSRRVGEIQKKKLDRLAREALKKAGHRIELP